MKGNTSRFGAEERFRCCSTWTRQQDTAQDTLRQRCRDKLQRKVGITDQQIIDVNNSQLHTESQAASLSLKGGAPRIAAKGNELGSSPCCVPCNYGPMISLPNTHTTVQDPT